MHTRPLGLATVLATVFAAALANSMSAVGVAAFASDPPAAKPQPGADARGAQIAREAVAAMGGTEWASIRSYESVARMKSAVGEMLATYRFVAPDAHLLEQRMNGGGRAMAMEMGFADGIAWTGDAGKPQAVDPAMAAEFARGGDVVTLLRSLDERFTDFRADGAEKLGDRIVERVTMRPKAAAAGAPRWTVFIEPSTRLVAGLEIPAPEGTPEAERADRTQRLQFSDWRAIPRANKASTPLRAPHAYTIVAGGVRTECVFESIAVDTLAAGSIRAPESLRARR